MIVAVLLIQAAAFAVLSGIVASNKNRDPAGWGIIGFLFGLFGFIAAVAVSEVEPNEKSTSNCRSRQPSSTREFDPEEHEKKCPMCAEYIKLEARRCKHCGHEFSDEEVERQIDERRKKFREKKELREKKRAEPREKKDPSELEAPPPSETAARCGECHYPLRGNEEKCPRCQRKLGWS